MPAAEPLAWTPTAWEDYLSWQRQDRNQLLRINLLIYRLEGPLLVIQACRYLYR
jgi:Txe/YoeB family toxin of Txe-Axe toxin-antitoxin module